MKRPDGIAEATRLTRAGKLREALGALRRLLPGAKPAKPVATVHPEPLRDLLGQAMAMFDIPVPIQKTTPPGGFTEHVFSSPAGKLHYKLFVPSQFHGETSPLLVMLHGCTQSPDDFAAGTRMNELAEAQGFLVAYPAQSQRANISKCWNWFNAADQMRDSGEAALIAGITRQIMAEYKVDPGAVYAAGMSAGGALAAVLGANYPDLYAAIGVHSGLACGAARNLATAGAAMRQGALVPPNAVLVPTIVFHGDQDSTVSPNNAMQVITQAQASQALTPDSADEVAPDGLRFTKTIWRDALGQDRLEQFILHGAGHAWSGGSPAGSFTSPRGPDASREMLRFFRAQSGMKIK